MNMSLDFYLTKIVTEEKEVLWKNITHNLTDMAEAAGIYKVLWRPNENGFIYARDAILPLEAWLHKLKSDPAKYEAYNSENWWGLYEHFVPFVEEILAWCKEHPDATIEASV